MSAREMGILKMSYSGLKTVVAEMEGPSGCWKSSKNGSKNTSFKRGDLWAMAYIV
jgi:hypothetical protein